MRRPFSVTARRKGSSGYIDIYSNSSFEFDREKNGEKETKKHDWWRVTIIASAVFAQHGVERWEKAEINKDNYIKPQEKHFYFKLDENHNDDESTSEKLWKQKCEISLISAVTDHIRANGQDTFLFPMNTHCLRGDSGHTLTFTHTFGQERSLSLFISGNPQLCPITQKIKSKISFSFSFSLYIYISHHLPFHLTAYFSLFPSLGSCELADVDYSINSLFIHLSVHPSIDSSLLF